MGSDLTMAMTGENLDARQPPPCGEDHDALIALRTEFHEFRKAIDAQFKAEEKVRDSLAKGMDDRLEGMNEFRNQLNKQAATFVTWGNLFAVSIGVATIVMGMFEVVAFLLRH